MAYGHSSGMPPYKAPVMIAERRTFLFSFYGETHPCHALSWSALIWTWMCTSASLQHPTLNGSLTQHGLACRSVDKIAFAPCKSCWRDLRLSQGEGQPPAISFALVSTLYSCTKKCFLTAQACPRPEVSLSRQHV